MHDFTMLDLREPSNISVEELKYALKNTALQQYAPLFIMAEQHYHLNALYLCAHAIWNSAWGLSELARVKHNLFGLYEDENFPYLSAYTYSDWMSCIVEVAHIISEEYLSPDGKFFHGPNLHGICEHHAHDDVVWERGVNLIMNLLLARMQK